MTAAVLATFAEISRALSTPPKPNAPAHEFAEGVLQVIDGSRRPLVAALLTIAVCIREGRADV
jgi:hypothetical protein